MIMNRDDAEPAPARIPIARRSLANKGKTLWLLTNHFKVNMSKTDGYFSHYSVDVSNEDNSSVDSKFIRRKVLSSAHETGQFGEKDFVYDGEKSLFTFGSLGSRRMEFTVVLEEISSNRSNGNCSRDHANENDRKRLKFPHHSKSYKVDIRFATSISKQALSQALQGQDSERSQSALRFLNVILRQHAAKQRCLIVQRSYFHDDVNNFTDVGGGVLGCSGFNSRFRTTQGGISLNIDVATTVLINPGPVVDFLIANQNVKNPLSVDWVEAKGVLKNLRVKISTTNTEYKITGLSEKSCKDQTFFLKRKNAEDENGEITVHDYFVKKRKIPLSSSVDFPCINVGKPERPTYFPLELCSLLPLQRYTKSLTNLQRASLVLKSRQEPQERMETLTNAMKINNYAEEPLLRYSGISLGDTFTQVKGRVLSAPKLIVGNGEVFVPHNGKWNFNNKELYDPKAIKKWAIVNFSDHEISYNLVTDFKNNAKRKGIVVEEPSYVFEEEDGNKSRLPSLRVHIMIESILTKIIPEFLLCILPERKNSLLYGPLKRKTLVEHGIVTQCIAPPKVVSQKYLGNVLLKINAKLGGLNTELSRPIHIISKTPTIILGMDVSHGSPGQSTVPSVAAVVSSVNWPFISRYRASVRTQPPKVEMINCLYKKDSEDDGIIKDILKEFYWSNGEKKPDQIIIFRDGVSESQFKDVLNVELDQIIEACKSIDEKWKPKFVVIIAQKNHHTKFFQLISPNNNVPPGTVIDNTICHPRNYDFYFCAQAGMIGTTRPTHYHVLLDEVGFSADDLQKLVHSLSYVYQRSTTAISVVAPIRYARLAATQMLQLLDFENMSETSSSHGGGVTAAGPVPVPQLPRLKKKVANSMFFV